jgi:hypothetical protein
MNAIIIHNIHDKNSREFIEKYGNNPDVTVIEDDGYSVRLQFPYISAFPTVIISTSEYTTVDSDGNTVIIPANLEYIRSPETWQEVQDRIDYWNTIK